MTISFVADSTVPTILGWTPGLRALLEGQTLPCGCLAGTYLTWGDQVVVLLDSKCTTCANARHRPHVVLWASTSVPVQDRPELDEVPRGAGLA
jgi:hypothetical protein